MVAKMKKKKNQVGQHRSILDTHLIEFMWRRKPDDRPFEDLLRMIQEQYSLVEVSVR